MEELSDEEIKEQTENEQMYLRTIQTLYKIQKDLDKINTTLCKLVSSINNINYTLNLIDKNIQMP